MKRMSWRLVLVAVVVIVALVAFGYVYASGDKAQTKEKAEVTSKAPDHQAGSAACIDAHKTGKCTGHAPGNCNCNGNCGGNCACGKHGEKKKG